MGNNSLTSAGAAYVFTQTSATQWNVQEKFVGTGTNGRIASDNFGGSVGTDRVSQYIVGVEGQELAMTEEKALGIGHPEAGHILAVHWKMPEDISEPIRFHHRPELAKSETGLTAMVSMATVMAEAFMRDDAPEEGMFEPYTYLLSMLELEPAKAVDVYAITRTPEMM